MSRRHDEDIKSGMNCPVDLDIPMEIKGKIVTTDNGFETSIFSIRIKTFPIYQQ